MSELKINEDLFLEKAELNRLQKFLSKSGYKLRDVIKSKSFGVLPGVNFIVSPSTTSGEIKISNAENFAINKLGDLLYTAAKESPISVPNDNVSRYLCIRYITTNNEIGTVSISDSGVLTGVGTKFTEVLRGSQTNYPSVIKLSGTNNSEYVVQSVVDDTNCVISGVFTPESNVSYKVVGTFTPGVIVDSNSKNIFQYDSVEYFFVTDLSTLVDGMEFVIAKVKKSSSVIVECKDYRKQILSTKETSDLYNIINQDVNPLIGIESIIWEPNISTKTKSIVRIGFGFAVSSFTVSHETSIITITGGQGGFYKTSADFTSNSFNNWRLYSQKTGKYNKIITSTKSGSNIICQMESVDGDYIQSGDTLFIVPDAEEIQLQICDINGTQILNQESMLTIPIKSCKINIVLSQQRSGVVGDDNKYVIKYRYKSNYNYSEFKNILKNKYTREDSTSFDNTPYTSPTITLLRDPSSSIHNQKGDQTIYPLLNANYYWDTFGDSSRIKFTGTPTLSGNKVIILPTESSAGGKILEKGTEIRVEWRSRVNPGTNDYQIAFLSAPSALDAGTPIDPNYPLDPPGSIVLILNASQLRRSNFDIKFTYLGDFTWQSELIYLQNSTDPSDGSTETDWINLGDVGTYMTLWSDFSTDKARIKKTFDDVFFEGIMSSTGSGNFLRGTNTLYSGIPANLCPNKDLIRTVSLLEYMATTPYWRTVKLIITTTGEIILDYLYPDGSAYIEPSYIFIGGISYKLIN